MLFSPAHESFQLRKLFTLMNYMAMLFQLMINDELLTIYDVANALRLTAKTVYLMVTDGELPAFKVRGQWRLRQDEFSAWLRAQSKGDKSKLQEDADAVAGTDLALNAGADTPAFPVTDLTERVSQAELHRRLVLALGTRVRWHADFATKPFEMDLAPPLPLRVRVYAYNATRPPGGRPLGEHKVQLIVPGQLRGQRASFDNTDGRIVLLVGYAAEEAVFVLWDAGLYADFAWSRNVQVKAETIIRASAGKLASQERQLRPPNGDATIEVVLAAGIDRLSEALLKRMELTRNRLLRD